MLKIEGNRPRFRSIVYPTARARDGKGPLCARGSRFEVYVVRPVSEVTSQALLANAYRIEQNIRARNKLFEALTPPEDRPC